MERRSVQSKEDMNLSAASIGSSTPSECQIFTFLGGKLDQSTTEDYTVLIFITVINIITFPVTTVLNVLVVVAVNTKPPLKAMSNTALGCLAATDGLMEVGSDNLYISRPEFQCCWLKRPVIFARCKEYPESLSGY